MVVKRPPTSKGSSTKHEADLKSVWREEELVRPYRTPWGKLIVLMIGLSLTMAVGGILGWGILAQRYPQTFWARWWPDVATTTVVREMASTNDRNITSRVQTVIDDLYGVALDQGQAGLYTQSDILTTAVPLSSNGWFFALQESLPTEGTIVVVPKIGEPAAVVSRIADPATPFVFLKTQASGTSSVTLSSTAELASRLSVWIVPAGGEAIPALGQILGVVKPRWQSSDRQDFWYQLTSPIHQPAGSAVLNDDGQIVGVLGPDQRIWTTGAIEPILKSLLQQEVIERPSFGITSLDRRRAIVSGDPAATGLLISNQAGEAAVLPNSPAEKAGLVDGAVLKEFDGQPLTQELFLTLLKYDPNDAVPIVFELDGNRLEATLQLGALQP